MDDNTLRMTMLFDFFGELLTDKQREYSDLYHNEDLSLSEIGQKAGISRQGVFDIISRAENTLLELENKTGVVQRWLDTRDALKQAEDIAFELKRLSGADTKNANLAEKLIGILGSIK